MISVVYDVRKYRELLDRVIREGDTVIELGPHLGKSTLPYAERTELTVVVDKSLQSKNAFKEIRDGHPNLRFVRGDARSFGTVEKVLELTSECDLMAVDLGGGRFPDTVFKVWATWSGIFKPGNSVIRNRGLAEFIQRAEIQDESIKKCFDNDGWLSQWGRKVPYKLKKQLDEFRFWVDTVDD